MSQPELTFRSNVLPTDPEAIREMAISTGFFYDYEIPVAVELAEDALADGDESPYKFLFAELNGRPVSYSCFGQILGTDAGYDLFWIITHNDFRGKGIGKIILEKTHEIVKAQGARFIVAETSGLDKYAPTRHFYLSNNYRLEADIPDFYKTGDSKKVYIYRFW
jgi:GNAT superfamily N-acetyltransferase